MANTTYRSAASSLALAVVLLWSSAAGADSTREAESAPDEASREQREPVHHFAFELNPVAIAVGRLSANIEALIAPHHGLILSPYYNRTVVGDATHEAGGTELGYRFFTGRTGPVGLYFGPSAFVQWGNDWNIFPAHGNRAEGVTFDVGGQTILLGHLLVGGGLGVAYTDGQINKGSHVFPRALASVGFAL